MNFGQGISDLLLVASKDKSEKISVNKMKYAFNFALVLVGKSYLWRDLVRRGEFVVPEKLDAGTVTTSQGSRTVTGNGTAFVADMAGWQISIDGETVHEIVSASGQSLTLVSKAVKSVSAKTYVAWKRYIQINSDVRLVLPNEDSVDLEAPFTIQGQNSPVKYTANEVSIVKDSNVLTGVGTSFLDNVRNGDLVKIQTKQFHIFNVESDIKAIMTNYADEDLTSSAEFISETSYLADVLSVDEDTLVKYRYLRHLFPLVHDDDLTGLPNTFDSTITDLAFAKYKQLSNLPYLPELQIAQLGLETLKSNSNLVIEPYYKFPPQIHAGMGRGVRRRL